MSANATLDDSVQEATFAGGCFWCVESAFNQLRGVINAESGYSNGHDPAPTYESVCEGNTGHAEVVRVRFDPKKVSYQQLLEVFFAIHDPTTLNRQGNDVGVQYRSGIYTHDTEQAEQARAIIDQLSTSQVYRGNIVTEVKPVENYHPAEAYHQRYFEQNPNQGYCAAVVGPKIEKFRKTFAELLKAPGAE
jgi:peptide-methionine (S)-S-oxide reductase